MMMMIRAEDKGNRIEFVYDEQLVKNCEMFTRQSDGFNREKVTQVTVFDSFTLRSAPVS
jgi:hypothetical protein